MDGGGVEAGFWLDVIIVFAEVFLVSETHAALLIENNNRTWQIIIGSFFTHSNHAISKHCGIFNKSRSLFIDARLELY